MTGVISAIRNVIDILVEPAIARLRSHEEARGNNEECFSSAGGQHLRFRCCVYFTTLAAALLEHSFGRSSYHPVTPSPYAHMARWLLPPYGTTPPEAQERLQHLLSAAENSGDQYDLRDLRAAASALPGPVGKYSAPIVVSGIQGTLWRCEVTTAHTYLIFQAPAIDDVYVDVTYKQFMVMPELLSPQHFEACRERALFADLPDSFVGTAQDLASLMTLSSLEAAHSMLNDKAAPADDLVDMHHLRNDILFALADPGRRRMLCGRPTQPNRESTREQYA